MTCQNYKDGIEHFSDKEEKDFLIHLDNCPDCNQWFWNKVLEPLTPTEQKVIAILASLDKETPRC